MNSIGERILSVRKKLKLTQTSFGEALGISQTHVSKIEKNIENPSETLLLLISNKFCINFTWLKTGEETPALTTGSSENGTIAKFKTTCHQFEGQFEKMGIDMLWEYVDAFFYFTQCLISASQYPYNEKHPQIYLQQWKLISQKMWMISRSYNDLVQAHGDNELAVNLLKIDRHLSAICESSREMVSKIMEK